MEKNKLLKVKVYKTHPIQQKICSELISSDYSISRWPPLLRYMQTFASTCSKRWIKIRWSEMCLPLWASSLSWLQATWAVRWLCSSDGQGQSQLWPLQLTLQAACISSESQVSVHMQMSPFPGVKNVHSSKPLIVSWETARVFPELPLWSFSLAQDLPDHQHLTPGGLVRNTNATEAETLEMESSSLWFNKLFRWTWSL